MRRFGRWAFGGLVCYVMLFTPPCLARDFTFEERMHAQRAIEQVYWDHRIWPKENPGPKPSLSEVLTEDALRSRVEDYLAESNALESVWHRPITADLLQAEMERMAAHSRDGAVLAELFRALGNDPFVIAETLARQNLADRLIREAYADDRRLHRKPRRRAEQALAACDGIACMRSMGGDYNEATFRLDDDGADAVGREPRRADPARLDSEAWSQRLGRLRALFGTTEADLPLGKLSRLEERADGFSITAIIDRTDREITIATATWGKTPFDSWWASERTRIPQDLAPAAESYTLVAPDQTCTGDTWSPTHQEAPDPRSGHTAVWTGSEMIVWGGGVGGGSATNTGGRYNPATDSWVLTSTGTNVPSARSSHTAVWTGSVMVVWGGTSGGGLDLNSGGRYSPSTNTWAQTSTGSNVPAPREQHRAVWTGSELIVWGGSVSGVRTNTGGRYSPSSDSWISTPTAGAPEARTSHTAVWTGSEMIVAGGYNATTLASGGRYSPSANVWTATAPLPEARNGHTAVWTGTQMIVWGGQTASAGTSNTGARYTPSSNTWAATSTNGQVPQSRANHTAVWTGSLMVVWGGTDESFLFLGSGGRYDPGNDSWSSTPLGPAGRLEHTAVWTGSEMLIWGGSPFNVGPGGRYRPSTNSWLSIPSTRGNVPTARDAHVAVWTGTEMIVWGGYDLDGPGSYPALGGRYLPSTDIWAPTSMSSVPQGRAGPTAVWTGTEMIVWGGARDGPNQLNTGGRYNPSSNSWIATSTGANVPVGRVLHSAVWTGTQMIVWGGWTEIPPVDYLNSGGRYTPGSNSWLPTSTGVNVPAARAEHTAVWTGTRMIVWGGLGGTTHFNSGSTYNAGTDSWSPLPVAAGTPTARRRHAAVWTGTLMIVWGGEDGTYMNTGGRYDPTSGTWSPTSISGAPSGRIWHSATWTGGEMIVWGGGQYSAGVYVNTGGRYIPAADTWMPTSIAANVPERRYSHSGVWTGSEMIIWGGALKASGGRYCACQTPLVYPDADGDGYGNPASPTANPLCDSIPAGYVSNNLDCDDANPGIHQGTPCDDGNSCSVNDTCSGGVCAGTCYCTEHGTGLAAWWPGEGNATDISGGGHNGTLVNGTTFAAGEVGQAFSFDGVNDLVQIPGYANTAPVNEVTVLFWQRVSSVKNQSTFGTNGFINGSVFNAHVPYGDGTVYWDFGNISTGGRLSYTPPVSLVGTWQHFALVASQSGNFMRIYRNGLQEAAKTGMTPFIHANMDLDIGGAAAFPFGGQIDEFSIFARALSASEIEAIYESGTHGMCKVCTDPDGDGYGQSGDTCHNGTVPDCSPNDGTVWQIPGADVSLHLSKVPPPPATALLSWNSPSGALPGALVYDVVRSAYSYDFGNFQPAACIVSDGTATQTTDGAMPAPGTALYYLVRAEDACGPDPGEPGMQACPCGGNNQSCCGGSTGAQRCPNSTFHVCNSNICH